MVQTTTFTTLQEDIRRYLERGFTLASDAIVYEQIPRLINLAERRIARELKVQGLINVVTSALQPGLAVYPKPDRWRSTVSFNFGSGDQKNEYNQLFPRDYEYVRSYWPDRTQTGFPLFYADYDYNNWIIAPTPDAAYPFEVLVYQLLPLLDDSNQTNWLTEYAPQVLLYATLLEATPFLKNDDRIPVWQQMYDRSTQALNGEDLSKILDRSARRTEA
ncbi:hypothetical protein UFOVP122_55 [uncultured Caudovirales phage]|uniref:Uncharacterized protein n=1 Tax=uncultured Caudovirales phage TaxID=2100421 RepID=A0A6J5L9C3_9CAUD|nr:hypothetical protein UFOVP122_55 [uncultured Caudovirales phage]